jgi:hypothetical protein
VYASTVEDESEDEQRLTFVVSGQLWNCSLVMMDPETKSLWSHILGKCMGGKLKGSELEVLSSDMLTWDAWKKEHPRTTVLNLKRTARVFNGDFYKQPERFVVGLSGAFGLRHVSFATLKKTPLMNAGARGLKLLVLADAESTSVRIFERKVGEQTLTFETVDEKLRDRETKSLWDRRSGTAVEGKLKGMKLEPQAGNISFTRAWKTFHPDSRPLE